jgi:glycosyltransferase involved in cell wall biosynthesis
VLTGAPSYSDAYASGLRQLADPRVVFLGHVSRELLEELYSHAYLCVLPSHLEGLSNALLEALAYQRCVLASDIPENRAVIEDHGMTFRCRDVNDLARALEHLLDSPELVSETGKRAGEWVLHSYSWDAVADATETLYRQLLGQVEE